MSRPLLEFLQSQQMQWRRPAEALGHPEVRWKPMSRDAQTGAVTALIQIPPGWNAPEPYALAAEEELFVLSGSLTMSDVVYGKHDYAFLPAGYGREGAKSEEGAVLLAFYDAAPERIAPGPPSPAAIPLIRTRHLPWDNANIDPNINHLHAARKNLRLAPDGSRRTYLLGSMPHGFPPEMTGRKERHPHVEEFFMVSGEIACSLCGVMRAGAYFWRPPEIWHGLDSSFAGFLIFARTPGVAATVSEWSKEIFPIDPFPPYRPVLPEDHEASGAPYASGPEVY